MRTYERSYPVGAAALAFALAVGASVIACGDDDAKTPTTSSSSSGGTSSGTSGTSGTSGGTSGGAALSLYARLGGKDGLEAFVKNVVDTKVLTDADLKTYFFNQVATPIPKDHPSEKQIVVCFARFVGSALKEDKYPGDPVADDANANTKMFTCRSMVDSHKGAETKLNIGAGTFDKFVGAIAAELTKLVKPTATKAGEITDAELKALGDALNAQKGDVTTTGAKDGPFVKP